MKVDNVPRRLRRSDDIGDDIEPEDIEPADWQDTDTCPPGTCPYDDPYYQD